MPSPEPEQAEASGGRSQERSESYAGQVSTAAGHPGNVAQPNAHGHSYEGVGRSWLGNEAGGDAASDTAAAEDPFAVVKHGHLARRHRLNRVDERDSRTARLHVDGRGLALVSIANADRGSKRERHSVGERDVRQLGANRPGGPRCLLRARLPSWHRCA